VTAGGVVSRVIVTCAWPVRVVTSVATTTSALSPSTSGTAVAV
jgi:hypothetical protein